MNTKCNICITEECKKTDKPYSCNCDICEKEKECNRVLRPIIRITTKCTQKCIHCCFECSPKKENMMSIETSKNIKIFLETNNINTITLMGGEFFLNTDWKEIFNILIPNLKYVRLVSNGDWVFDESVPKFLSKFDNLKISISKDKWHNNINVDKAIELCEKYYLNYNLPSEAEISNDSIVPVGRSMYSHYNMFSLFSVYCHDPKHMYSFLIDEEGEIYKCGFGIWNYTNIKDHLDGSFDKKFKEIGLKVNKVFISNCQRCAESYYRFLKEQKND